jgi:molybdopterin-containing oxidoreductase family iron-sulfur binding subunit
MSQAHPMRSSPARTDAAHGHAIHDPDSKSAAAMPDAATDGAATPGAMHAEAVGANAPAEDVTVAHRTGAAASEVPAELSGKNGQHFWQSLEELAGTERFKDFIAREYPSQASRFDDLPERRTVLKLMGASLALAGFNSCTRQPDERILPYAKMPEAIIPGQPLYYATAMPWAAGSIGLLVENHMGRPTKIEGNELHPASLGATDPMAQGAVLTLYDPDRATNVNRRW